MHRSYFAFLLLPLLALMACGNEARQPAGTATMPATIAEAPRPPASNLNAQATGELVKVRDAYYTLKDALVSTDPAKADAAASKLMSASELLHHQLMQDTTVDKNVLADLDTIMQVSEEIIAITEDKHCTKKRALFAPLSETTYHLLQATALTQATVYRQYCPMAFNNKGAYWLSAESDIKNPYFGDKMLECGEVTDSLK